MDLEKRIDTVVRPIPYLEEQRTRDAKYIAQLQEQVASLIKSVDGMTNRLLVVEDLSNRNTQNVEDLVNIRRELQDRQRRFLEEMQLSDQQRERNIEQWAAADEVREQRMAEFAEQMRIFADQYQKVRSALTSLETLGERLQREQHEVTELQRLTEERQRRKMEEWESETEKRWQRERLLWEQQWHDHDRRDAELLERVKVIEGRSEASAEQVSHLWEVVLSNIRLENEMMQNRTIKLSEEIEARRNRKGTH
jgi:chromosome segregation ATPase